MMMHGLTNPKFTRMIFGYLEEGLSARLQEVANEPPVHTGGPHRPSECFGKEKNPLPLPGFDP